VYNTKRRKQLKCQAKNGGHAAEGAERNRQVQEYLKAQVVAKRHEGGEILFHDCMMFFCSCGICFW